MTAEVAQIEKPMLFSAPMVQAILAGRKTQTRRIIKTIPCQCADGDWQPKEISATTQEGWQIAGHSGKWSCSCCNAEPIKCAHPVGSLIWVRETWSPDHEPFYPHWPIVYKADKTPLPHEIENGRIYSPESKEWFPFKWRPSIFMRKHHARIRLRVESVRVERLSPISDDDAISEGVEYKEGVGWRRYPYTFDQLGKESRFPCRDAKESYYTLWESINGPGSWAANPWVWAYTFTRATAPQEVEQP
jgi:hypothetical protein